MKPSVRDLEQALSIRRQINALEKRLAAILRGSIAKPKARRRPVRIRPPLRLDPKRNKKEGHRKLDRRPDDLCADGLRKRVLALAATITGIALQRFDALTRDDRNHENCSY